MGRRLSSRAPAIAREVMPATSSRSTSGTDSDSSGPVSIRSAGSAGTFESPFGITPRSGQRSDVIVSTLALALTSVLWQQPQWRATPSPSGASESSQNRRQASSADGDSGRSHLSLHDAAFPLCSSVTDNNSKPTFAPLAKIACDEFGGILHSNFGPRNAGR